jgi:hypothetical protein
VFSSSQGFYLNTGQHKHRKTRIQTHDNSVRASEDSSRLRQRGYSDLLPNILIFPLALQSNSGLSRLHENFRFTSVTRSRTPWTGDQLVARPVPVHEQKNAHTTQTLNIPALSGIQTRGPGVRRAKTFHGLDLSATVTGSRYTSIGWRKLDSKELHSFYSSPSNNIKIDLRDIGWDDIDWTDLARDRDQWRALVNTVMNLRVP